MRARILDYLRVHPTILNVFWKVLHCVFLIIGFFVPVKKNVILITSFAGRKFDDSPKALYEEICRRKEFDDWKILWAFVEPNKYEIPRGEKIKIDSIRFFLALLYSRVWISNSGMDRNIGINRKKTIKIETWHGTPLKKIGADQNSGVLGNFKPNRRMDLSTIRCAQSEYDMQIFIRIFNADRNCFIMSDLPRNDLLFNYTDSDIERIRKDLGINSSKKVLLYMPTYREYLVNEKNQTYLAPPMNIEKWRHKLGEEYVLLFRAHYAVTSSLGIKNDDFVIDVSNYPQINDLYVIAYILISDYSSAYFDYAILDKPIMCFAYDLDEYNEKRGLYVELDDILPCEICRDEDAVISGIENMKYELECKNTKQFHNIYAPFAGEASRKVIDRLIEKI